MKIVAIIQARFDSKRLPGKVLKELGGKPALQWVIDSARAIPAVDAVVVATSDQENDRPIAEFCAGYGCAVSRGDKNDVLGRMAGAARANKADVILRITADCPFLDPALCGTLVQMLVSGGFDYASNCDIASWPDGLDCEVMTAEALYDAEKNAKTASDREHVTPYIRARQDQFSCQFLRSPVNGLAQHRWTLDDADDYTFLNKIASRIVALNLSTPALYTHILDILADNPDIVRNNAAARNEGYAKSLSVEAYISHGYKNSDSLLHRAEKTIPLGAQTFSKSKIQFPQKFSPLFLSHGRGGRAWDVDGNSYVDLVGGLLPNVLGYCDPDVDAAITSQLNRGISFSLSTRLESELADRMIGLIPCAEKVRFGKNGTDATSAAVRLARAYTGRDHIVVLGYHGWQDWYIGSTTRYLGVPDAVRALTHKASYNDIDSLKAVLDKNKDNVAAVVMEVVGVEPPKEGYLQAVQDMCRKNGTVLIFDEIISGFRVHAGGAQAYYGVTPDLAAFGKAMGNGMPISAVVGRADIMNKMEDIFYSGTFGGETLSLAASIAVIDKMCRENVIEKLWATGTKMEEITSRHAAKYGLTGVVGLKGLAPWKILSFQDYKAVPAAVIKTKFLIEMLRNGVLIGASHNVCYAHNDEDLAVLDRAYDMALSRIAEGLDAGNLESTLESPVLRPVFTVRSS